MKNFAWVTVITKSKYETCAGRLYQQLKYFNSKYPMEILVSDDLSETDLPFLTANSIPYTFCKKNSFLDFKTAKKYDLIRYNDTLFKFKILDLIKYDYICFIDADILIWNNIDYLWDLIDQSSNINCFYAKQENRFCGELFFMKPQANKFIELINKIKADQCEENQILTDELCLQTYFIKEIHIINHDLIINKDILHLSGSIKLWDILWRKPFRYWFFESSIEVFIKYYINNKELISNIIDILKKLNSIQDTLKDTDWVRE